MPVIELEAGVGRVVGQRGDADRIGSGGSSLLSKLRSAAALRRLGQAYVSIGVRIVVRYWRIVDAGLANRN